MKANKLLFSVLTLAALICLMSVAVFAGEPVEVYDRVTLKAALEDANVDSIVLTDNISLSGENWVPVTIAKGRTLVINGAGNVISDMTVRNYLLMSDGSEDPTSGHAADYRAGLIGYNLGDLTINDLKFANADIDIEPLSEKASGSAQLGVVCGLNTGALVMNNVEVKDSLVKGYNKLGALLGHLMSGSFTANKCIIDNTQVRLEKDGYDPEGSYAGLILGTNQSKTAKTNGIKIINNSICTKDSSIVWDGYEIQYAPISNASYVMYTPNNTLYGIINQSYKKDEHEIEAVQFVAEINGYEYETLEDAFKAAVSGDEITLLRDAEINTMINFADDKSVILDLNGNVLTTAEAVKAVAEISNGSITLADSASTKGKINASNMAFRVIAGTSTSGTLIIEKDVAVFSENECAIFIKGQDATLITEGNISTTGVHAAISGNGNPENGGIKVYINGGEVISEKTAAIYFPNTTLLQITDGVFTGSVAVYQKSGKLDISGGTFIANGEKADYVYNPSGLNSTGDALVVESCNYPGGVPTVSITGGYFSSKNNQAIASYNDKGGKDTLPEKIAGFISGGYFTSDPTEFLVTGKVAVPSTEEGYLFTVADKNSEIEVETSLEVAEPVIENKTEAQISGDFEVDVETLKAEASALLNDSSVIDSEEAVAAVENLEGYVSGETVVTVVVQPYMEVEITDFVSGESLTVDITPKYNLVATISGDEELVLDGDDKNAVVLEEGKTLNVTKTIEVTIPLPQGFADGLTQVFVHHKGHIYTADIMNTASGDVAVFTNPHGFSEFSVKRTLEAVAQNTTTNEMYDTLEASINEVTNNETIMLLKANNENVVVDRIVTFVFNTNGFEYSGDITAGSTVVLEKIANDTNAAVTYAFTKKQTSPVVGGGGSSSSTYTIKFETNNGSKIENVKVEKNAKLEKPLDPTKDGYTFDGWYTDKECKVAYNFNIGVTKGFTLYAKWTENKIEGKQNTFGDVTESDWYYDAIEYVFSNKLFNGITETEFAPMMEITRAMLVTVLYRYEKEPEVSGNSKFIDVADGAYYNRAVIWAETNGIVNGISDSEFAPDNKITREQIVTIMFRFAKYKGIDVSVGEDTNILSYDDVASVSEYAIPAMQWAVGSGLMKGKTESTLNPKDTATRAEVATILQRFIENNK